MIVISNQLGKPVAVAPNVERAQNFVYRNVERSPYATSTWTETGKLYVNGRWTGWEIKGVEAA